jgi:ArsR family transcriptional regulator
MNQHALSDLFRSIGDPVRLRLLHLLLVEELSVGELVQITGLPQSTVSRQLKILRGQHLLADRSAGPATFYRGCLEAELSNGETGLRDALSSIFSRDGLPVSDRRSLERVLALRLREGEDFFERIGLQWDALREGCFGRTFHLEALIALLPSWWKVADLGMGTGYLLPVLARHFSAVIGVDNSRHMLDIARHRVAQESVSAELRYGDLEDLPIEDGELDLAIMVLMLHHFADIPRALREVRRILKPEGRLLIVEFEAHQNEVFRARMADRRAGIARAELGQWLSESGFGEVRFRAPGAADAPEPQFGPVPDLYICIAGALEVDSCSVAKQGLQAPARRKVLAGNRGKSRAKTKRSGK